VNADVAVNAGDVQPVREQRMERSPTPFDPARCNVIGPRDAGAHDACAAFFAP
jgi:hypothetical protein